MEQQRSSIVEVARAFAVSEIEKFGLPDRVLFEISERKALELASTLHADITIVYVGICLIDCKLGQAFQEGKLAEHVRMSADAAKVFLQEQGTTEAFNAKVLNCIEAHHGGVPFTCLEAEICANADCYRFLTPKGFLRYVTILGKRSDDFQQCLSDAEKKLDEKYKILSLDVCKRELEEAYRILKQLVGQSR